MLLFLKQGYYCYVHWHVWNSYWTQYTSMFNRICFFFCTNSVKLIYCHFDRYPVKPFVSCIRCNYPLYNMYRWLHIKMCIKQNKQKVFRHLLFHSWFQMNSVLLVQCISTVSRVVVDQLLWFLLFVQTMLCNMYPWCTPCTVESFVFFIKRSFL